MIYYSRHKCRELVVYVDKFLPNIPITTQTEEPMPTEKQIARQINNLLGELVGLSKYPTRTPVVTATLSGSKSATRTRAPSTPTPPSE